MKVFYMGRRLDEKDRYSHHFQKTDKKKTLLCFYGVTGNHEIGGLYCLKKTPTGFTFPRRGLESINDDKLSVEWKTIKNWQNQDMMAESERARLNQRKKIDNSPPIMKDINKICEYYYSLSHKYRAAFLVALGEKLTRYSHEKAFAKFKRKKGSK